MFNSKRDYLKILMVACLTLIHLQGITQDHIGTVHGVISNGSTKKEIGGALVRLFKSPDSSFISSVLSDSLGKFFFLGLSPGRYLLNTTYKELSGNSQVTIDSVSNPGLLNIALLPRYKELESVTLTATRPILSFDGDKLVFNVENAVGADGSSAFEMLRQVPGIVINNSEETINLNGQSDITIMIDDRKRTMSIAQTLQLLKSLPANNLKQIEVINNKSARFDAAGSGGVINIVTKKRLADGYNLQFSNSVSIDNYVSSNSNFFINYRSGAFSVYSSLGYTRSRSYGITLSNSVYEASMGDFALSSTSDFYSRSNSPYGDVSVDYSINRNHVIGISATGFLNRDINKVERNTLSSHGSSMKKILNRKYGNYPENLNSFDILYNAKFDTLGSKLKVDIGRLQGFSHKRFDYHNEVATGSGTPPASEDILARLPLDGYQNIFQLDLEKVMRPGRRISFGFKHTAAFVNNYVSYDTVKMDGLHNDRSRSQNLEYNELITAAYVSYSHKFSKTLNATIGIRYEKTKMRNLYPDLGDSFVRDFNDIFPSAGISVNRENLKYSFNINRSISRPYYGYLNSYTTYLDAFSIQQGNSSLRPGYIYSFSATAFYKNIFQLSSGYSYGRKMVTLYRRQFPDTALTIIRPENALNYSSIFISSTTFLSFLEKRLEGQIRFVVNLYKNRRSLFFYEPADLKLFGRYTISSTQSYKISKRNTLELSCFYYSRYRGNQFETKSLFQADLGLRVKLMENKLTASLQISDLFKTMGQQSYIFYEGVRTYTDREYNSRRIRLSLVFSLGRLKDDFQKSTSSENERKRFKEE